MSSDAEREMQEEPKPEKPGRVEEKAVAYSSRFAESQDVRFEFELPFEDEEAIATIEKSGNALIELNRLFSQVIEQMSLPKLDDFVSQVIELRARRRAPSVPPAESELLLTKINRGLPSGIRRRLDQLIAKRQAETLTPEEHRELLRLTDQLEAMEAERAEALTQLARLRGVSLTTLMCDLGITTPNYA